VEDLVERSGELAATVANEGLDVAEPFAVDEE